MEYLNKRATALADRFKNRTKRPPPPSDLPTTPQLLDPSITAVTRNSEDVSDAGRSKRVRTEYEKEVEKLSRGKGLKDEGGGVVAMLK